jgi:hypothetical protein
LAIEMETDSNSYILEHLNFQCKSTKIVILKSLLCVVKRMVGLIRSIVIQEVCGVKKDIRLDMIKL